MDLLIHAIIWLFKALFGDQEPPAQLGPRHRRGDEVSSERGPYQYGDGDSARPARKAQTLSDLLEEARRQTQGAPVEFPAPEATHVPPPSPVVTLPPPLQPPRPVAVPVAHAPAQVFVPPPISSASTSATTSQPVKRSKKEKRKKAVVQASTAAPIQMAVPGLAYRSNASRAGYGKAALFTSALRDANPKQKREALVQAVILAEIFSPPRSRKALRRSV